MGRRSYGLNIPQFNISLSHPLYLTQIRTAKCTWHFVKLVMPPHIDSVLPLCCLLHQLFYYCGIVTAQCVPLNLAQAGAGFDQVH